jgi:hypothetical protein
MHLRIVQSIPVDSCVLGASDSLFLQQASHLTKGVYGRMAHQDQHALLQYLMVFYSVQNATTVSLKNTDASDILCAVLLVCLLPSSCTFPMRPHELI